ncbi:MAG: hypothetical protein MK291_12760, partial [Planctomycetes bacterium]|nr:hypothetical protein [Planctomycetota bacterium]
MLQALINAWARRARQPWVALFGALLPGELPLPNSGFDADLSGWTVTAPAGSVQHGAASGAEGGSARLRVGGGADASLEAALSVGDVGDAIDWLPSPGQPGERPRFGARVMRTASSDAGTFALEVAAVGAAGERLLARGEVSLRGLAQGRWLWVDAASIEGG